MSSTPTGTSVPSMLLDLGRRAVRARWSPRFAIPTSTTLVGTLVALDDLVGDPGEGTADVVGVEQLPASERS